MNAWQRGFLPQVKPANRKSPSAVSKQAQALASYYCNQTELLSPKAATRDSEASRNGKGRFFSGCKKLNRNRLFRPARLTGQYQ